MPELFVSAIVTLAKGVVPAPLVIVCTRVKAPSLVVREILTAVALLLTFVAAFQFELAPSSE